MPQTRMPRASAQAQAQEVLIRTGDGYAVNLPPVRMVREEG